MVAFLLSIHQAFVPIVLAAGALALVSGLSLLWLGRGGRQAPAGLRRAFRVLLVLTACVGLAEDVWGALLWLNGCRPAEGLHYVYGGIVLLAIPVAYVYSDQSAVRRDIIIMTIAAVAVMGAAVRALMTGPGGVCLAH